MSKIKDKIEAIEEFLEELKEFTPAAFEEYASNKQVKAACERAVEKVIEAVTDLSFIIISIKKLKIPEDDIASFRILAENKIIPNSLYLKLKDARGMRNILIHQYGEIDDNLIFSAIKDDIEHDVKKFLEIVKERILKEHS